VPADVGSVTEPRWSIRCHDPFGRDRALTIFVEGDRVLVVPPPGAAAVLNAQQTRWLNNILDQAAGRTAERRVS
jgi:hypothetical protein